MICESTFSQVLSVILTVAITVGMPAAAVIVFAENENRWIPALVLCCVAVAVGYIVPRACWPSP